MSNNNNINISINDSTVSINDINLLNTSQVIQLINSSIDKFVGIQNSTLAETSGIQLYNLFDGNMNGNYYQMNTAFKTVVLNKIVRFIIDDKYNSYYKQVGEDFLLIIYLDPTTDDSFNNVNLLKAWYILKYKKNPNDIHMGINHYTDIYEEPVLYFLGEGKKIFGSNSYPDNPFVIFF